MLRYFLLLISVLSLAQGGFFSRAHAVVISEIHYHPRRGEEALEFIEVANDTSTPEDLSGYAFVKGIQFVFPPGTILHARDFLVICASVEAVKARYGIENAIGNYKGQLDNGGERITLVNQAGIAVQDLNYRDEGKWPVEPDGAGHTLSLVNVHLDSKEPESWIASPKLGGTPGRPTFEGAGFEAPIFEGRGPSYQETAIIPALDTWRYMKGTGPFSDPPSAWSQPDFDDSQWLLGAAGFGFADDDDTTVLTDMQKNYSSVACRKFFDLTAEQLKLPGDFYLAIDFDDGFCAYLNGLEIAHYNCPSVDPDALWNAVAADIHEAGVPELFKIPRVSLIAGRNILAIVGFNNKINDSDFSLSPAMTFRQPVDRPAICFNELYRGERRGSGWVELFNGGSASADLSGFRLVDDPARPDAYTFPAGTAIEPRGFLIIRESDTSLALSEPEVRLFLIRPDGEAAAAAVFDREPATDWPAGSYSEGRFPDGGRAGWIVRTPTPASANQVSRVTGIVINEIFYHPPEDRVGEFIELYNRGKTAIDLSGCRFANGIEYVFPEKTALGPGEYLVLAADPEIIKNRYGLLNVHGPWSGNLSNRGENIRLADRFGNLIDEVRYRDGGNWSMWADGGGSSLELIDPQQENDAASAWEGSDETAKSSWEQLSFSAPHFVPANQTELHLYLVERGICRLDDISIQRSGDGQNLIPNPGFETDTLPWRIEGTHVRSRRIAADKRSGEACLELVATGKGDALCNRIETDTVPKMAAGSYLVSLWARWQRGSSLLIAHGEFTPGPWGQLSGNTLAARLRLSVPWNLGTPGAENSASRRLREETGAANLGPILSEVRHQPPLPLAFRPISLSARVSDSDGIASVTAFYREGNAAGDFTSVPLYDDGAHEDGAAADGLFRGELPSYPNRTRLVFYLEAIDQRGAGRRFPIEAPEKTCVLMVELPLDTTLDVCRIILDTERTAELQRRPLHSNDLVDGTLVYNNEEAFYNVGVRYQGSAWGRPSKNNFRVRFADDQPFLRGHRAVNFSDKGSSPNEGSAYFFVGRSGTAANPAPTADYFYMGTFFNGVIRGTYGVIQTVDVDYIEKWYGDDAVQDAIVLKGVGRPAFNDSCSQAAWDGAYLHYRGEETENYRAYWIHSLHQSRDRWEPFLELTRIMDGQATPDLQFDREVGAILDVEEFLRVLAARILVGSTDALFIGAGHNGFLAYDPRDGLWEQLPFDLDSTFGDSTLSLFSGDPFVARMLSRPAPRRAYFRILAEFLNGYWSVANASPYLETVQKDTNIRAGTLKFFIATRATRVNDTIVQFTSAPFRILTGNGNELTASGSTIELEGEAPVQIASMSLKRNGGPLLPLTPEWLSPIQWRARAAVPAPMNQLELFGFAGDGLLLGTASVAVRNVSPTGEVTLFSISPGSGAVAGGTRVTFQGGGFFQGIKVFFGDREAVEVSVASSELLRAVAPPAKLPLAPDHRVDIQLFDSGALLLVVPGAFTYLASGDFVRGDASGDLRLSIADPIAILLYLYRGRPPNCLDAADFTDDGAIDLSDAIGSLRFLFQAGEPPPSPFPSPGPDPTADGLKCQR
ncbi:MAG: lamin tail domain-containing protein [Planctomycetes bacterium]|nr:lamin tail domain-containing protein [Planctomycetota bacterium]